MTRTYELRVTEVAVRVSATDPTGYVSDVQLSPLESVDAGDYAVMRGTAVHSAHFVISSSESEVIEQFRVSGVVHPCDAWSLMPILELPELPELTPGKLVHVPGITDADLLIRLAKLYADTEHEVLLGGITALTGRLKGAHGSIAA